MQYEVNQEREKRRRSVFSKVRVITPLIYLTGRMKTTVSEMGV